MGWVHLPSRHEQFIAQRHYGESVEDWLRRGFPDLCDGEKPHPAAIAETIRLHYRYGRGTLTRHTHGELIRQAVNRFRERYETQETTHGN